MEDLSTGELILHVGFLNGLDGHLLACEFMDAEGNLAKCSFADQLDKFIELQSGLRELICLGDVVLYILDKLFTFIQETILDH